MYGTVCTLHEKITDPYTNLQKMKLVVIIVEYKKQSFTHPYSNVKREFHHIRKPNNAGKNIDAINAMAKNHIINLWSFPFPSLFTFFFVV